MRGLGRLAGIIAVGLTVLVGAGVASAAATTCRASGNVLASTALVLVWHVRQSVSSAHGQKQTYDVYDACTRPAGRTYVMYRDNFDAMVGVRAAGDYVAYTTGGTGGENLSVFDASNGRTTINEAVDESGGSEPYEPGPLLGYVLSSDGWIAWADTLGDPPGITQALFAQGAGGPLLLDLTSASIVGLSLSGEKLSWLADGGEQSVTLGPGLQPPAHATPPAPPANACKLITPADAQSVLGGLAAGSGAPVTAKAPHTTTCTYTATGAHPNRVTVTQQTGLSAAAVKAADNADDNNASYMEFQLADQINFGYDAYFGGPSNAGTIVTWQDGVQVTVTLSSRISAAGVERLAFLALARLGWTGAARA